jgi:aminopeptidase 2
MCIDRVLYTPERLAKIASETAKEDSVFTLNDRIGLVHDSMALARAGFAKLSSAMNLVNILRNEKECNVFFLFFYFDRGELFI